MRRLAPYVLALACLVSPAQSFGAGVPPQYAPLRRQLRSSAVPVLLPMRLPRAILPAKSITVLTADATGYTVGFSPEPNCYEALACAFFHVAGFTRAALSDRSYRQDRKVRLADGTRGYFHAEDCSGASCSEASLTFERYGAIYELDVRLGADDLPVLLRAYRSLRIFP